MRWLRSLTGRITLVTIAVTILTALVTGVLAFQLVQANARSQARTLITREASTLASLPPGTVERRLGERLIPALDGTTFAVVEPNGTVTGSASVYLSAVALRKLANGGQLSSMVQFDGQSILLESHRRRADAGVIIVAQPLQSVDQAARAVVSRLLLALAIGLVVAIVAGGFLARWIAAPLRRTAAAARRLAAGERNVPLRPGGATEVVQLSDALASLDAALVRSEGRQREFLLSISHELRTPLTALRGYGEALTDGMIAADDIASVGATLVAETERLDHFVRDLLELARMESDDFSLEPRDVDLVQLLRDARAGWRGIAVRSSVEIVFAESRPQLAVSTDPRRIRQIVDGLIENALRATPAGGTITLGLRQDEENIAITVRDTGPGLTANDRRIALQRGLLQAKYRNIRAVGTGLGLSIAARLATRLGGRLDVPDPDGSGTGAVFELRLPLRPPGW